MINNVNQYQENGINVSLKQNTVKNIQQNFSDVETGNLQSKDSLQLKLKKLSNSSNSPMTKIKTQDYNDIQDPILCDLTDSNCGSPDTRMESSAARISDSELNLFNLQDGANYDTTKISLVKRHQSQDGFLSSDSLRNKIQQSRQIFSNTSSATKESGFEQFSNDIGISPFNFEQSQRFSGKIEMFTQQKNKIHKYPSTTPPYKLLDEVLEEDCGIQGRLNSDVTDESLTRQQFNAKHSNYDRKDEDLQRQTSSNMLADSLNNDHQYFHSNSTHTVFMTGIRPQQQLISTRQQDQYDEMQGRIFKFFESEGIFPQAVGEAIHDINNSAFKGMSKLLSPLKLDLTKSPLRRLRANTIQL